MTRRRFAGTRRMALATVLTSVSMARVGTAQAVPDDVKEHWEVGTLTAAWCVHFLMEPAEAQEDLVRGYRTLPAQEVPGLPAAFQRMLAAEPEFSEWVPGRLCVAFPSEVTAGNRHYDRGDGGKPLGILWWGVAAAGDRFGAEAGGLSLRLLATNSSALKRQMEIERIRMERITIERGPVRDSDDERTRIKLGSSEIVFDGHPRPDSSLSAQPIRGLMALTGEVRQVWMVEAILKPTDVASLSGALRIQGKGGIAKILNRSPIRLLSVSSSGGSGELLFHQ